MDFPGSTSFLLQKVNEMGMREIEELIKGLPEKEQLRRVMGFTGVRTGDLRQVSPVGRKDMRDGAFRGSDSGVGKFGG